MLQSLRCGTNPLLDDMFYLVKYVHSALGRIKSAATSAQPTRTCWGLAWVSEQNQGGGRGLSLIAAPPSYHARAKPFGMPVKPAMSRGDTLIKQLSSLPLNATFLFGECRRFFYALSHNF